MKTKYFLLRLSLIVFLSGCAAFDSAGDIAQGRQALFRGDYQTALGHFQSAQTTDPTYIYGTELQEGVLSYVGRAQYLTGNYEQARQALEKALSQQNDDNVARLYIGLTLARLGDRQKGLQEIDAGMKGIHDFIDYISDSFRFSFGKDWDIGRDIRSTIEKDRAMIASGKIDWSRLIADGEWVGMSIEREPDMVRQEQEDHQPMFRHRF
jgi:tetratricopeptide (TPR) repeat protein